MPRDEVEAAYFALLRAREELDALRRYDDYLADEVRRIRRFLSEGAALFDGVDGRLCRALRQTDTALADALKARLAVVADEQARLPDRVAAAEAFVESSEREHSQLKHGR